jgi:PhnB protein
MVRDATKALAFYLEAFAGEELMRFEGPPGRIAHAEVKIGDSHVMLADENPQEGFVGPQTLGGAGVSLMLYVRDVDATFARAVAAGATVRRPVADQFYGDRVGTLTDPFGHVWSIATHREDVSVEEAKRRMASLSAE